MDEQVASATPSKPTYTYSPTIERFTRITWSPEHKEPAVTIWSNFGVAAKLTGNSAIIFTEIVGHALSNIQERERAENEAKRNPPPIEPVETPED